MEPEGRDWSGHNTRGEDHQLSDKFQTAKSICSLDSCNCTFDNIIQFQFYWHTPIFKWNNGECLKDEGFLMAFHNSQLKFYLEDQEALVTEQPI